MTAIDLANAEEVINTREEVEVEGTKRPDTRVEGPAMKGEFDEKKLKKVVKEGGKRGVEIEGAADMGGLKFFCTNVEEPAGDLGLLLESMKGMNALSDPSEEERKGGSGHIGKMLFSVDEEGAKLAIVAYVPKGYDGKGEDKECKAIDWLTHVCELTYGKTALEKSGGVSTCDEISGDHYATALLLRDTDQNLFPMKLRDPCITNAYSYLKARDLFPDGDDEDDDDVCYGDEDFEEMLNA